MTAGLPQVSAPPRGWRARAACRGADLALFFPGRGKSAEPAQQVCARCTVRAQCLDYALSHAIRQGIWGGLAERDRRPLRARRLAELRQERDRAILAAHAAGYSAIAIGQAFGVSRMAVQRVVSRGLTPAGRP